MTLFERFVTEGREAADWLAKQGTDLDGGATATIKAAMVRQDTMKVYAALQYAATLHRQLEMCMSVTN